MNQLIYTFKCMYAMSKLVVQSVEGAGLSLYILPQHTACTHYLLIPSFEGTML